MKSENSFLFTRLDAFKPNLLIQSDSCGLSFFLGKMWVELVPTYGISLGL